MLQAFKNELLKYRHGLGPVVQAVADAQSLPFIRGTYFYVDPIDGVNTNDGRSVGTAVADFQTAYGLCTTNVGDGIVVIGVDATTTANTTSYLKAPLDFTKNGITVVGICAPTKMFQRARISNKVVTKTATTISFTADHTISDSAGGFLTAGFEAGQYLAITNSADNNNDFAPVAEGGNANFIKIESVTATTITTTSTSAHLTTVDAATSGTVVLTSYNWYNIRVSGSNNSFYNIHVTMSDATAYALDALVITGHRNYFANVHSANGLASAATVKARSLQLSAAQENTFVGCTFGTDTVDRGNNATYDILLSGAVARNRFIDCETIRHTSAGVAGFAVFMDTTTGGRPTIFDGCRLTCYSTVGGNTVQTAAFGSTGACDDVFCVGGTTHPGYGSTGLGGVVFMSGANVAAGVGGVLTTQS